jgi:hypothetical protein
VSRVTAEEFPDAKIYSQYVYIIKNREDFL